MFKRRKLGMKIGRRHLTVAEDDQILVSERPEAMITINNPRIVALGDECRMVTRIPEDVETICPLQDIEKYPDIAEHLIEYLFEKALNTFLPLLKPRLVATIPTSANNSEKSILLNALGQLRTSKLHVLSELEAPTAGIRLNGTVAVMNVGYCGAEVALFSSEKPSHPRSILIGGHSLDQAILDYMKEQHNLVIGELSAELAKIRLSKVSNGESEQAEMNVHGRNLTNGMPNMITLTADEISNVIARPLFGIVRFLQEWLRDLPIEEQRAVRTNGIVLTGGTALIPGIDTFLSEHVGVPMRLAPDPAHAAAIGASRIAQMYDWKRHPSH